jgi:aromatic ring-cleaving dioxygenase
METKISTVIHPNKREEDHERYDIQLGENDDSIDLIEPSFKFQGGYRDVLERYYTCYIGPHQEAIYQHSNG